MEFFEVEHVLDELDARKIRFWVGGGWGVAALAGAQTREHRDLDLAVDASDLSMCLQCLEAIGYSRETDWLPVRVEYAARGRGWIDVHPIAFDAAGHGRQAGLDGGHFDYPPDAFATGSVHGRVMPCLSLRQQRAFHSGYEPGPQDLHDLDKLAALERTTSSGRPVNAATPPIAH